MTPAAVLPAHHGQVCPCGAPAVYGLLWRQPPGSRPALRHALDPLPPSAGPTRPPPAALPSSSGEGQVAERSAAPVEARVEPPAVAVAESEEAGRGLPAQEPLATAGGQPISTPDPWDGPEGRAHSEPQEAPVARAAATLPPVDPVVPPGRCRLLGCATPSNVRGLCLPHYDLARRKGQLDELALPPIPRGRGTRFQRPAESAPSTRPQRAPRTRRAAAPRHEGEALRAIWVALGSPELAQSESLELEILRAAERRLRLDAHLDRQIRALEEDGVRLRSQLLQSQQENYRLETLKTSVLSSIPPTTLAFDGYNLDVLIRAALDAERSRVNDLRAALAEIVDQDLDGQTDADLIAAATSEIQRLRELLRGHKDELRTIYEAIEATPEIRLQDSPVGAADFVRWLSREHQRAVKSVSASTLETPESLERRYQALHTARRLRDLLEGREGLRVQLPEGVFTLQQIWLWDLLEPMLPGEIERLEREAGVSRG